MVDSPNIAKESCSAVIPTAEAARNNFNLSPSRYVAQNGQAEVLPLEEEVVLLEAAEGDRSLVDKSLSDFPRNLSKTLTVD
jgi:type I restriction enzyme M protein